MNCYQNKKQQNKSYFYNKFASDFDSKMNMYDTNKRLNIIFNLLLPGSLKDQTVLDAGCGTGWFSEKAINKGANVFSLDIGYNLLKIVQRKCKSYLINGSLINLPIADNSFDIVICTEAIEHTTNPEFAFKELCRVLKRNGILIITVPNKFWHWSVVFANYFKLRPYEGYENWCSIKELLRWSYNCNMLVIKIFGFNLFPFVFPITHKLLDIIDKKYSTTLAKFMVNLGLKCMKR